jgi:hypothetical protein
MYGSRFETTKMLAGAKPLLHVHGQALGGPHMLAGIAQPCLGLRGRACFHQALGHGFHFAGQRRKEAELGDTSIRGPSRGWPIRNRRSRSATRTMGRIRNQRTMSSVTPTIRARRRQCARSCASRPHCLRRE